MCQAIYYHDGITDMRVYFSNQKALLPVMTKAGTVSWLPWGRHKDQPGNLPLGGWARLERIQDGHWNKYFPRPVKIPAHAFMENDFEGNSVWHPLVKGQCLQGLHACYDKEQRIYLVTITPTREDTIYERWPRIVRMK